MEKTVEIEFNMLIDIASRLSELQSIKMVLTPGYVDNILTDVMYIITMESEYGGESNEDI